MPLATRRMSVAFAPGILSFCMITTSLALSAGLARAQDLEPRAYSASPAGANFVAAGYTNANGSVSLDPSLPIKGLNANVDTYTVGYDRSFDLLGRSASLALLVPEFRASLSGQVVGQGESVSRSGLGDVRMRAAVNLLGGPALTPAEFARREPATTLGASLSVVAPTGQYEPDRLINIGSNRWAIKPEVGVSQPIGKWFAEAYAGTWLYTPNNDYFRGHKRGQDPIYTFQVHGGYTFRPSLWLAADATYYDGGRTYINGLAGNDLQSVIRAGLTLSVPLGSTFSAKLAWSSWLTSRNGGQYQTFGVSLQYLWFDRPAAAR